MSETGIKKNIALWNVVSATNPKHTKKVKLGREFTAIDPYSQIHEATKAFGPVGKGWGWQVSRIEYTPTDQIGVLVQLWHSERDNTFEQWGQAGLYIDKNKSYGEGLKTPRYSSVAIKPTSDIRYKINYRGLFSHW